VHRAFEATHLDLSPDLQQSLQAKFHRLTLGTRTGRFERVGHKLVVNHNVGSHVCNLLEIVHILLPDEPYYKQCNLGLSGYESLGKGSAQSGGHRQVNAARAASPE
jgi:hypothetical protein